MKQELKKLVNFDNITYSEFTARLQAIMPQDTECFAYCYLKTLQNLLALQSSCNEIEISSSKNLSGYHRCSHQQFSLGAQDHSQSFDVTMDYYSNGIGDDIILHLNYDETSFFVSSRNGVKLRIKTLV